MTGKRIGLMLASIAVMALLAAWLLRPRSGPSGPVRPAAQTSVSGSNTTPVFMDNSPAVTGRPQTHGNPPRPKSSGEMLNLLGSVLSEAQATLSTRLPARIVAVLVKEGQSVQRGQVLVRLDEEDFRAQERAARTAVATAQAQVNKAQAGRNA